MKLFCKKSASLIKLSCAKHGLRVGALSFIRLSPTVLIQKEDAFYVLGRPQLKGHGSKTALLQQATQTSSSGCLLPVVGPTSLRGDAKGPSEDPFLGSTSAWTQNGLQVCLLRWSTF